MSTDGQGTKRLRNIAENFNPLSRVHERYRRQIYNRQQTDMQTDRQTDGRTDGRTNDSIYRAKKDTECCEVFLWLLNLYSATWWHVLIYDVYLAAKIALKNGEKKQYLDNEWCSSDIRTGDAELIERSVRTTVDKCVQCTPSPHCCRHCRPLEATFLVLYWCPHRYLCIALFLDESTHSCISFRLSCTDLWRYSLPDTVDQQT